MTYRENPCIPVTPRRAVDPLHSTHDVESDLAIVVTSHALIAALENQKRTAEAAYVEAEFDTYEEDMMGTTFWCF